MMSTGLWLPFALAGKASAQMPSDQKRYLKNFEGSKFFKIILLLWSFEAILRMFSDSKKSQKSKDYTVRFVISLLGFVGNDVLFLDCFVYKILSSVQRYF